MAKTKIDWTKWRLKDTEERLERFCRGRKIPLRILKKLHRQLITTGQCEHPLDLMGV